MLNVALVAYAVFSFYSFAIGFISYIVDSDDAFDDGKNPPFVPDPLYLFAFLVPTYWVGRGIAWVAKYRIKRRPRGLVER